MRELAVLRMVWASAAWMAVEMFTHQHVANIEEVGSFSAAHDSNSGAEGRGAGDATTLAPCCVPSRVGVAPGRRVWRARRRRMVMNVTRICTGVYMDLYHVRCKLNQ